MKNITFYADNILLFSIIKISFNVHASMSKIDKYST